MCAPLIPNGRPVLLVGPHRITHITTFRRRDIYMRDLDSVMVGKRHIRLYANGNRMDIQSTYEDVETIIEKILVSLPSHVEVRYGSAGTEKKWKPTRQGTN